MGFVYPDGIISTAGHVDHGKTTVVYALSGIWVARHSEEVKKAMTIKLGYIQIGIYECSGSEYPLTDGLLNKDKCPDSSEPKLLRKISIVDVPGHEVLIATMVSGAAAVDAALMVVDATASVPQPQTAEHFAVVDIIGVRNMVVAQNKIDLVTREKAVENYNQIRKFLADTWAQNSPVVPVSALHRVNIDVLAFYINKITPRRDPDMAKPARMAVLRSFNVNPPGTPVNKLRGGVLGGTMLQGVIKVGEEVEIRPGLKIDKQGAKSPYQPLITKIVGVEYGGERAEEARPGGLVGLLTTLDPALAKADALAGSIVGKPGSLPPVWTNIELEAKDLPRSGERAEPMKHNEVVMVSIGPATVFGVVQSVKKDVVSIALKKAIAADEGAKAVITRQIKNRWLVSNYGVLRGGTAVLE